MSNYSKHPSLIGLVTPSDAWDMVCDSAGQLSEGIRMGGQAGLNAMSSAYTALLEVPDSNRQRRQRLVIANAAARLAGECGLDVPRWAMDESEQRNVRLEDR